MEATDTAVKRPRSPISLLQELSSLSLHKPRSQPSMAPSVNSTAEKFKPLTVAELNAQLEVVRGTTGKKKKTAVPTPASTKKRWNSSIKVDKLISHTGNGQMKHNAVRKQLYSRSTMANVETPKFPKQESRVKKAPLPNQAKPHVRISGVYKIPQTPAETNKPITNRLTIANKENLPVTRSIPKLLTSAFANRKEKPTPKKVVRFRKSIAPRILVPDTPQSNNSSNSNCDASFLQKEKEILEIEERAHAIIEEQTLENIAEVSPPASTPFNEYKNVQEYFNNTSDMETSVHEDTIMCFDKPSISKENPNNEREESVIVYICDLFNKAAVSKVTNKTTKTELEILKEIEKETKNNIKSQLKLLRYVHKLIQKKKNGSNSPITFGDKTLTDENNITPEIDIRGDNPPSPCKSPILGRPCSVIRSPSTSRSPSYKIPNKKNGCLGKKVISKSMPDISIVMQSPNALLSNNDRARSMYINMKAQMEFLKTPVAKERPATVLDTPGITKHNLQVQLDKLFNNS